MTDKDIKLLQSLSEVSLFEPGVCKRILARLARVDEQRIEADEHGNITWSNHGEQNPTLILFRMHPMAVMYEGNRVATPLGNTKPETIKDSFCYRKKEHAGVIRMKNDEKKTIEIDSVGEIKTGEVFTFPYNAMCKGDMLYGSQLKTLISLYYMALCINAFSESCKAISLVISNETLCGQAGTLKLITSLPHEQLIIVDSVSADDKMVLGKGVGVVLKDGNFIASESVYEGITAFAKEHEIDVQPFIGKADKNLEQIYLAEKNKKIAVFYLPVEGYESAVEKISAEDVEKTQNLLLNYTTSSGIITL